MTKKKQSYTEAIAELENIIEQMEQGELDIDDLTVKVQRAAVLIQFCKNTLHKTREDVDKILDDMEDL